MRCPVPEGCCFWPLCEEGRPKEAGEPCDEDDDCTWYDEQHVLQDELSCDTARGVCVECFTDADCPNSDSQLPYCLPDVNVCVECYLDEHCPAGYSCEEGNVCLPDTGRGLCEICEGDDQCGGPGDRCLSFRDEHGNVIDKGCGRACSGEEPCPSGYKCAEEGDVAGQCVPFNSEEITTCAAIRDMGKECSPQEADTCGVEGVDDAHCELDWPSFCTVRCSRDDTCVEGWECPNWDIYCWPR